MIESGKSTVFTDSSSQIIISIYYWFGNKFCIDFVTKTQKNNCEKLVINALLYVHSQSKFGQIISSNFNKTPCVIC
jgi:hypothetical protein